MAELVWRQSCQNTELPTVSGPGGLCPEEAITLRFFAACRGSRLLLLRDVPPQAAHPAVKKPLANRWGQFIGPYATFSCSSMVKSRSGSGGN